MKRKVAVIGAWSVMGRAILDCLAELNFPAEDVYALDGRQSVGMPISYGVGELETYCLDTFNFGQVGLSFLCTSAILIEDIDKILGYGQYLIDCIGLLSETSYIVFEKKLKLNPHQKIILNPTGLSVILTRLLKSVQNHYKVKSGTVTALLPVCEFGTEAIEALINQTRSLYTREPTSEGPFCRTQAFNLIPAIAPILARHTMDQMKKLLQIPVQVTTCLTPIFQGECLSLFFTTKEKTMCADIERILAKTSDCHLVREIDLLPTIGTLDVLGNKRIYISHLKSVSMQPNTYHAWILCDSFQTGAALNAVRIAEHILS